MWHRAPAEITGKPDGNGREIESEIAVQSQGHEYMSLCFRMEHAELSDEGDSLKTCALS